LSRRALDASSGRHRMTRFPRRPAKQDLSIDRGNTSSDSKDRTGPSPSSSAQAHALLEPSSGSCGGVYVPDPPVLQVNGSRGAAPCGGVNASPSILPSETRRDDPDGCCRARDGTIFSHAGAIVSSLSSSCRFRRNAEHTSLRHVTILPTWLSVGFATKSPTARHWNDAR
jgi:hypothetical protein